MKKTHIFSLLLFATGLLLSSCKKDEAKPVMDVVFEAEMGEDGSTIQFTNQTPNTQSVKWDFGDGQSSTELNPSHTYASKGKYVPTLTVTSTDGRTDEGSTVIRIAKLSPVRLDDNSFADWATVPNTYTSSTDPAKAGIGRSMKIDYNGLNIYLLTTIKATALSDFIFDIYIDADVNPLTGVSTYLYPNGGFEILLEGILTPGSEVPMTAFYHTGKEQTDFVFTPQNIEDFFQIGHVELKDGLHTFEMSINRTKLRGLSGTQAYLGMAINSTGWAQLGSIPDIGTPRGILIDMAE